MKLPTLYHKGRTGAIYSWRIWCEDDEIVTEYGQIDGVKQIARKKAAPKNEGKANATTAKEQALLEAASMHKFKLDRKYSLSKDEATEEVFLPMLAHDYMKRGEKAGFPLYAQVKYDGVRTLAYLEDGEVQLMSRGGKPYFAQHIASSLQKLFDTKKVAKSTVFDGEIYQHGVGFQTISKLIKKQRPESVNLEYHIYDLPIIEDTNDFIWDEREIKLRNLGESFKKPLIAVPSIIVRNLEEIKEFQAQALLDGFEGTILRTLDGVYEFGYRSPSLLKYKAFDDDEFVVTGYEQGVGKYAGAVTWICKGKSGQFKATPKGTLEEKRDWFANAKRYVGKHLKVKYQGFTDDGLPRFPIGLGFRDMEMDK